MVASVWLWVKENYSVFLNAGSLMGSVVVTSLFGFFYWWYAARLFSATEIGIASAATSVMLLLGEIAILGFGTLLVGKLPRSMEKPGTLITPTLVAAALAALVLGGGFLVFVPMVATEMAVFTESLQYIGLFIVGVILTAIGLILDQATLGLHRADIQLLRNTVFSLGKLLLLISATLVLDRRDSVLIYLVWVLGIAISLFSVLIAAQRSGFQLLDLHPNWGLLRHQSATAIRHHILTMADQVPGMTLPLIATAFLSASIAATFFISWMLTGFARSISTALSVTYYALVSKNPEETVHKLRLSLGLALVSSTAAGFAFLLGARPVLALFGSSYANTEAQTILRILSLNIFPYIITVNYIAVARVNNTLMQASTLIAIGGFLQLLLASIGAYFVGPVGLSAGLVLAQVLVACITLPSVLKAAFPPQK